MSYNNATSIKSFVVLV